MPLQMLQVPGGIAPEFHFWVSQKRFFADEPLGSCVLLHHTNATTQMQPWIALTKDKQRSFDRLSSAACLMRRQVGSAQAACWQFYFKSQKSTAGEL